MVRRLILPELWRIVLAGSRRIIDMQIHSVGNDLGKTTFHLVALSGGGKVLLRKKFTQEQLITFTANMQISLIGMEACAGAHFLSRTLREQGHDVRLIPAQFVRPFVKSNKNDFLDAEAIAEAVDRQNMRFVPIKTDDQLDLQAIHRVRDRLIARRTSVINQLRASLIERGMTFAKTPFKLKVAMPDILENAGTNRTPRMRNLVGFLWSEWKDLKQQILGMNEEIEQIASSDSACRRLRQIPGIGPLVATAIVAAIGNRAAFHKSREFSSWLGLVPRQHSTGGKDRLLGISKRGNKIPAEVFRARCSSSSPPGQARAIPIRPMARCVGGSSADQRSRHGCSQQAGTYRLGCAIKRTGLSCSG
jgi:transposase